MVRARLFTNCCSVSRAARARAGTFSKGNFSRTTPLTKHCDNGKPSVRLQFPPHIASRQRQTCYNPVARKAYCGKMRCPGCSTRGFAHDQQFFEHIYAQSGAETQRARAGGSNNRCDHHGRTPSHRLTAPATACTDINRACIAATNRPCAQRRERVSIASKATPIRLLPLQWFLQTLMCSERIAVEFATVGLVEATTRAPRVSNKRGPMRGRPSGQSAPNSNFRAQVPETSHEQVI